MSAYILPILFLIVFVIAMIKKVPIYDSFIEGIKESLRLVISIFPYICAIFIAIELFRISGLSALFTRAVAPVLSAVGIPPELAELLIIRPMSGNGSIAILKNIFTTYGADSYIARCASVIVGCSETIFYVSAVYFSTSKIRKLRYAIPVSLISCLLGAIISCLICRFM